MDNLIQRAITGSILVTIIISSIVAGPVVFILLMLLIDALGLLEFYRLFHANTIAPRSITGIILSLSILATFSLVITNVSDWRILMINMVIAFSLFILELYLKALYPFQNLAILFLGIICITIPLCFFISLGFIAVAGRGFQPQLVLGYFFILWSSDTGAFLAGKYVGRHHLFKRISPKKTWEGSLGGMVAALAVSYIISFYFSIFTWAEWMSIALIIVVIGTYGDLIKSLMKRSLNIKDSGTILPGHGGILDRFDSLLGSAPFVFYYLVLFHHA